jgi:hypothetical protein
MATYHALVVLATACLLIFLGSTTEATSTTHPYASFIHLAAVAAWFGVSLWVTFVAGVLLYKYLPHRHLFGEVQGKIFPYFFGMSLVFTSLALGSWAHLEGVDLVASAKKGGEDATVVFALGGAAVLSALQLVVLGPSVTKAMDARNKLEKVIICVEVDFLRCLISCLALYHRKDS